MKILVDIGHPAHVHYFRNFYQIMKGKGHKFLFIARRREVIEDLLKYYKIDYISRGEGKDSAFGKLFYMLYADFLILKHALIFKPDIFISFSSPYAAQVATFLNKPHIAINDTEHTDKVHSKFTYPFSKSIITPKSYQNDLGFKHVRIDNIIESFYLHPKYFKKDPSIFEFLKIDSNTPYVILRFVSWNAFHDVGQGGISIEQKREIVKLVEQKFKVFISSERELDQEFSKYQIKIPPEKMHDALAFASLFISESGTMASESALLGTPVIYVNSLPLMCYLKLEQEYGLLKHFKTDNGLLEYINNIISNQNLKEQTLASRDKMVKDFINPTDFLAWFIENYPQSKRIMKDNPDYQYNFK